MSEDFLSCAVCLEYFNDHKRAPLLLVCGHTFCSDCIKSMHSSKSKIRCPNCNKEDSRAPKDLPKNHMVTDLVLKLSYSRPTTKDPWLCRVHPNESIIYICQKSKKLLCCECLHSQSYVDLSDITSKDIQDRLQMFKNLFDLASPNDLKDRSHLSGLLAECIENQKFKVAQYLDDKYSEVLSSFENHFSSVKNKILNAFDKEKEKVLDLKGIFSILALMKNVGVKLDEVLNRLGLNKSHDLISYLSGISDLGSTTELKKIASSGIDFSFKAEIPAKLVNFTTAVVESPINLIKGSGETSDIGEKKLSRFNPPTNRWGIFEGRNQIEAVTFTVNQKIYMTGIGVGNAYHAGKVVKLERVSVLDGGSTMSAPVYDDIGIDLVYESTGPKVVKIPFKKPVEIKENSEFTIKLVLRGGAGVFRGGSTTRTRNGENGLLFKFKNTIYGGDDVKNGENADDGPIFDIYYKTVIDSQALVNFIRYTNLNSTQELPEGRPGYILTFNINKPLSLTSFSVPSPSREDSILQVKKVEILKLNKEINEKIFLQNKKLEILFNPTSKLSQIMLDQIISLEPQVNYSILVEMSSPAVFKAESIITSSITCNQVSLKAIKSQTDLYRDSIDQSIFLSIHGSCIENIQTFTRILIPNNFLEEVCGEMKVSRFESCEPGWGIQPDGQVECFSFKFSEDVILTGLALGNCVKSNSFVLVETLNVLVGQYSNSPAVYEHSKPFNIFNSDNNPKVKVKFDRPVKIDSRKTYTFKIVMKGTEKVFKGKSFRGESITGKDEIVFKASKTELRDGDKSNGDNEKAGPILEVYYLNPGKYISPESFSILLQKLYPKVSSQAADLPVKTEEMKVTRYSSTGSSWHVNTDGKQIEAISFKPSMVVNLTGVGIGNAHEEGKKVVIKKIQVKEGKSTQGRNKVYKHKEKVKLINTGDDSKFVKIQLHNPVSLTPDNWYTLMVKYKPGVPVCRGTMANNQPSANGVTFTFEKTKYEGPDIENGSHEVHGPLRDFYFTLN